MADGNRRTWQCASEPDSGSVSPGLIFGLAIIAIGLAKVVDSKDTSGRTGGAMIMLVGLVLIADKVHLPFFNNVSLWSLWPVALIVFGAMMLWGALEGKGGASAPWIAPATPGNVNMFSIFGGSNRKVSGDFKGADLVAIFGGGGLDLRNASMSGDEAVVNVNAVFGGFEVRVPETWLVQVQVTGIFGGHEDKTHQPDPRLVPNPKRLLVRGATIFGGLGVKN